MRDAEPGGDEEGLGADRSAALTSLGFLRAALKRSAWFWCATAVLGIIVGYGLYTTFPPAYQATTTLIIYSDPSADPVNEIATDLTLAQSQTVAQLAVQKLGLQESASVFLAQYTVTDPTTQAIVFTVSAPSSAAAVQRASVLSSVFLQFRTTYLTNQLQTEQAALAQQVTVAQQQVDSISQQIDAASADAATTAQQAKLASLRTQLTDAQNALTSAQYNASNTESGNQTTLASEIKSSYPISAPTPLKHTLKTGAAFYVFVLFFVGLVIGMAIVIIRALISDRLRRRDEIAEVIGAPVRLSIRSLRPRSRLPRRRQSADQRALDMRRMVSHLSGLATPLSGVPASSRRLKGLAIVAVDNAHEVAPAVAELAAWNAKQGKKVVVADLAEGRPVARLLGVSDPGIHPGNRTGAEVVVVVPPRDDIALMGPLPGFRDQPTGADPELTAACASADLLFTMTTLDPASGGDYLSTWAADAAALVTAGQSSSTRIRAVGDMIRLAGLRLASVVLTGADKDDESLGLVYARDEESSSPLAL